jgi:hypothetical protein
LLIGIALPAIEIKEGEIGARCIVRAFLDRKGHPNLSYFKSKRFIVEGQEHSPIEVPNLAAFLIGTSSCPEPRTRTCTDYRNGQEHSPITD